MATSPTTDDLGKGSGQQHVSQRLARLWLTGSVLTPERTRGALQDSAAAEQKAKAGAQPEKLHRVLELENLESLQLFNKYVHIPSVFAAFQSPAFFFLDFFLLCRSDSTLTPGPLEIILRPQSCLTLYQPHGL